MCNVSKGKLPASLVFSLKVIVQDDSFPHSILTICNEMSFLSALLFVFPPLPSLALAFLMRDALAFSLLWKT